MDIYSEVFDAVRKLLVERDNAVVAIDGRCGSGKTTLAAALAAEFDCNVFHLDDFFLPSVMRTTERLAEPGGNVHHERFLQEVLVHLRSGSPVCYRPYICSKAGFGDVKCFEKKRLSIIEGSYSLHPSLRGYYDLKIFLTLDPQTQEQRILQRSGPEKLADYKNQWIPMEELYFRELDVQSCCDMVLDTGVSFPCSRV